MYGVSPLAHGQSSTLASGKGAAIAADIGYIRSDMRLYLDILAMAADSIQRTNVAWQLRHLGKNASEWIQLQLVRGEPTAPREPPSTFEWPAWIGEVVFWVAIVAGVVWLAWVVVQLVDRYRASRQAQNRQQPKIQTIDPLPERTAAAWLREAQELERQGNWRAACRAFYLATLQVLHDREWVTHLGSRTDGEYLSAINTLKRRRPLQLLIRTHERAHFGAEPMTADNLQHCRRAYEEIDKP